MNPSLLSTSYEKIVGQTLVRQLDQEKESSEFKLTVFHLTSPSGNTPQGTNYTATCLPSRKLYKLDEPDTQDTAGEARTNSSVMYSYGPPHMAKQKQDGQLEHTYSNYVRIRDIALKTCQKRWMIGRSGERGSGISVVAARHDDDDDDDVFHLKLISYQILLVGGEFSVTIILVGK